MAAPDVIDADWEDELGEDAFGDSGANERSGAMHFKFPQADEFELIGEPAVADTEIIDGDFLLIDLRHHGDDLLIGGQGNDTLYGGADDHDRPFDRPYLAA